MSNTFSLKLKSPAKNPANASRFEREDTENPASDKPKGDLYLYPDEHQGAERVTVTVAPA